MGIKRTLEAIVFIVLAACVPPWSTINMPGAIRRHCEWEHGFWVWLSQALGSVHTSRISNVISNYSLIVSYFATGGDVKIPTYKPHTNHKRSSVRSHTLAPTSICDLSHFLCRSQLTDLGHISSVTYVCHPLWFVCGHRKGILTSPQ